MSAKKISNEITITRIYDAPVSLVWDAWTDPKKVEKWWGPRGFSLTTHGKDLRPGGFWSYTMHGPDGANYENKTLYHEVEQLKRLVYDHGGNDDRPPLFRVTVNFSEEKGRTKMEMSMRFSTAEIAEQMSQFIKKAGGESTWDRLAEYLCEEETGKEKFFINRSFNVSIERMFDMWTNPEHLSKWLAPTGFTMKFMRSEIQEGASTFYYMGNAEGVGLYGRAEYLKVSRPHQLLYTQQFCDENEKISRHPMAPIWPETMLTKITFTEEGAGRTRVTIEWEAFGDATREEVDAFKKERGGMTQGWTGSFDKLEIYLG
jgi:uncharacterized protein YndB with AHSA1/START domain